MTLARQLTRSVGRNQIKELRSSDYPQAGLRESIIPDAVNTSIAGTEVIAIRCNNHFEPTIINSRVYFFNNSGGILNLPFLNIKKGSNGQGVTFSNNGNPFLVQTSNKTIAQALLNNSFKRTNVNQSSITSFVVNPALNSNDYVAAYSNNFLDAISVNSINKSTFLLENRLTGISGFFSFDYIEAAKGGVKNVVTQIRSNVVVDFISFNGKNNGIGFFVNPYPQIASNTGINQYRVSGVEPLGTLTYSQTNTNQNNNAAWLLRQLTQYQRQFNKLKTLGV